jgi:hypothetical protein
METRILLMFSIMIIELGCGISGLLGVNSNYPRRMDEAGIAGCVMIVAVTIVSWLITIAIFIRKSSRTKAARIVDDARLQAARILSEATDKSLALCSLDSGRCIHCGNPRTGRFCPKCGKGSTNADAQASSNSRVRSLETASG